MVKCPFRKLSGDNPDPTITVTTTLQAAINAAGNGAVIYVPQGTWADSWSISNKANLTIYGAGVTSVIGAGSIGGTTTNLNMNSLCVKDDYDNDWNPGIQISKLSTGHFHHIDFKGMGYSCINAASGVASGQPTYWDPVITGVEVDYCTSTDPLIGEYGFYVGHGCYDWNLHHNTIGKCEGKTTPPHQFYIQDCDKIYVEDNYCYGNTKSNAHALKAGIDVYGDGHSFDCHFNRNTVLNCTGGVWLVAGNYNTAAYNVITVNDGRQYNSYGLDIYGHATYHTLDHNTVVGALYSVRMGTATGSGEAWPDHMTFTNNTVSGGVAWTPGSATNTTSTGNSWD